MDTIIEIKNATKRFQDKTDFQNMNLDIYQGGSYGFIGYNGCGKSVFFKTICGFSRLNEGQILYRGKEIGKDIDFITNAGVVIETPSFLNDLSGFKNLKMIAQIQNKIGDPEIEETLKEVGLYEEKDKKVKAYSLGMKQKLRLAQALMEKPEILILDEPTNGLDKSSVLQLRQILNRFVADGGTLLLTSHNKDDIQACCQYIYEFENQELTFVGENSSADSMVYDTEI